MFTPELYLFQPDNTSARRLVAHKRKDESGERPFTSFDLASIAVGVPAVFSRDGRQTRSAWQT